MKIRTFISLLAVSAIAIPPLPAIAQDSSDEALEEIIVVGIRGSIQRAEAIKSEAKNIVEAITTEEFGKFSDDSLADSLRRLPGVQVEEDLVGSAGDKVSIRGLGPQFVIATVNGRTAWSSGSGEGRELRSYNFSVIPSEVVNEVLVTKTPIADTVESGIGGAVDVRTLRPLDAQFDDGQNYFGQVDLRTEMSSIGDESWGPRLSGALIGKNDAETIGAFLAFNYSEIEGGRDRQQVRYRTNRDMWVDNNNNYINDPEELIEDATTLRDILYSPDRFEQERGAISGALQFNPTDELSIVADVLFTRTDRINRRPNTRFDVDSPLRDTLFAPESIVFEDGGLDDFPAHTTFVDISGARCILVDPVTGEDVQTQGAECANFEDRGPGRARSSRALSMRDQFRNNFRDSWLYGLNVQFDRGAWHISGDIFENDLDTVVMEASIDAENANFDNPLIADIRGNGPFDSAPAESDLEASNYDARRLRIRQRSNQGDQVGARVDFEVEMDNDAIESIQFGARYNTQKFWYSKSQRPSWGEDEFDPLDPFNDAMRTDGYWDPVNGVALPAFDIFASEALLSEAGLDGVVDPGFGPCVTGNVSESLNLRSRFRPNLTETCLDLRDSFNITEDTTSAYAAINLEGMWGNVPVAANFGLRYVETKNTSTGVITVTDPDLDDDEQTDPDPNDRMTTRGKFSKVLPSLNLRFDMSDTLQLRFAAAESLSRPDLYQLASFFDVRTTDDDGSGDFNPEDCDSGDCEIRRGNPNLDPYTAWNYDLTLMWATPTDAFVSASLFYKDIDGFIFDGVSGPVTLPGYGDAEFFVRQPTNASTAEVLGFEIAVHQPFTFFEAPFDGLGVQLNYSYTDSEFSADVDTSSIGSFGLPGASKNNLNAILYWETERFGARLAYVYRDDYFSTFGGGAEGNDRYVVANEKLSATLSFDITDNVEIRAQGANLTADGRKEFITYETLAQHWYSQPRSYSIGVRVDF